MRQLIHTESETLAQLLRSLEKQLVATDHIARAVRLSGSGFPCGDFAPGCVGVWGDFVAWTQSDGTIYALQVTRGCPVRIAGIDVLALSRCQLRRRLKAAFPDLIVGKTAITIPGLRVRLEFPSGGKLWAHPCCATFYRRGALEIEAEMLRPIARRVLRPRARGAKGVVRIARDLLRGMPGFRLDDLRAVEANLDECDWLWAFESFVFSAADLGLRLEGNELAYAERVAERLGADLEVKEILKEWAGGRIESGKSNEGMAD